MRERRTFLAAAGFSALLHGALIVWLPHWPSPPPPVVIELELAKPAQTAAGGVERLSEPEREPEPHPPPDPEQLLEERIPEQPDSAERSSTNAPEHARARPELADESAAEPERATTILNLRRPESWSDWTGEDDLATPDLPFNTELAGALERARQSAARRAMLLARRASVYGVADDLYRRNGPRGVEMKRDGACMRLEESDVEEGQRWWASACAETKQNPFELERVEYDALGRLMPDHMAD